MSTAWVRNRLANVLTGGVETLAVRLLTFVLLANGTRPPAYPAYVLLGMVELALNFQELQA